MARMMTDEERIALRYFKIASKQYKQLKAV